jgi:hypothetical protein
MKELLDHRESCCNHRQCNCQEEKSIKVNVSTLKEAGIVDE